MSAIPASVRIREVGPRDGFQNEPEVIPTDAKVELIDGLARTGVKRLEVTSFVRADVIPQLAVAVRRLHDVGRSARELWVPCVMLLFVPLAFAFRGILPQIVALGFFGFTLIAFANLLRLFLKQGSRVPNNYGGAPTAFSFADSPA